MSEDQFDIQKPKIECSVERIEETFILGEKYEGTFSFCSSNDVNLRGIIYSSNPYVQVINPQFDGEKIRVHFQCRVLEYHVDDLLEGTFTIIANQVEQEVPFRITFKKKELMASTGALNSLADFAQLAKDHWNEAMQLFYSDAMLEIPMSNQEQLLYKGFRGAKVSSNNLESFLVAVHQKEPMTFALEERTFTFEQLQENQKEVIDITKNTWGYIEIQAASSADFVTVEKERINSDFFLGSRLSFNIYIHKNHLHAGRNEAVVTFDANGIHKEVRVIACLHGLDDTAYQATLYAHQLRFQFTDNYRKFRFKQMTTGDWCKESLSLLDEMEQLEQQHMTKEELLGHKRNTWYQLMRSQALLANRQKQDALWIISDLKKDITDKKSTEWAYLLYLCTLIEPEESYVNKLTEEIERIYREQEEKDPRIFWFLLFLRERYVSDYGRKLKDIGQWILEGYNSPFLYIEAYYIYTQEPYQLTEFHVVSKRILQWACNHHIINKNITLQIAHVLEREKEYDEKVYRIAKCAYEMYPEKDLLFQMLSYLLKNQRYGEKYLYWYTLAIERQVRLTGLYEAYLQSLPESYVEELPELITLYFRYQSNLPYQRKALIYANVIGHKKSAPNVYEQYLNHMESFAMEQMRLGRIDDNMAIIYQDILDIGLINSDVANAMSKLLFTNKVICAADGILRVILYESYAKKPKVYSVDNGIAYVPILTEEYQIFLEREDGTLLTSEEDYYIEPLLCYLGFYQELLEQSTEPLPYIIHNISTYGQEGVLDVTDIGGIDAFLGCEDIARSYRASFYPKFLAFLTEHGRQDIIERHLLMEEPYDVLDAKQTTYLLEITIQNGFYEKAYQHMKQVNGSHVDSRLLLKMLAVIIDEKHMEAEDDLITLAAELLKQDLYSMAIVSYLELYFVGPTALMCKLCNLCEEFQIKAEALMERTMIQMLYTEEIHADSGALYRLYAQHNPNRMVVEAYLTYFAHAYMLDKEAPQEIFEDLLRFYHQDMKLNESCRFALMKYLCTRMQLDEQEYAALDQLVKDAILRNIYFAFFKQMDRRLVVKYHLYDKTFLEYHGHPRERIRISYCKNTGLAMEEDMLEMYDGIYMKEFVLFFGDTIDYEIYAPEVEGTPVVKNSITFHEGFTDDEENRYALLNRMQSAYIYGDLERLEKDMKDYQGLDQVTKDLFTII